MSRGLLVPVRKMERAGVMVPEVPAGNQLRQLGQGLARALPEAHVPLSVICLGGSFNGIGTRWGLEGDMSVVIAFAVT